MTPCERTRIEAHPIILYDGVCALCNGVVRYLLQHDRNDQFRFIPQQTPLAEELLAAFPATPAPEGVILITAALTPNQSLYRRSDAIDQALHLLHRPYPILARTLRFIPHFLRELGYSCIARYRYRLFGKYSTCPIPTPSQQKRILGIQ